MRKKKIMIIGAIAVCVVVGAGTAAISAEKNQAVLVTTALLEKGDLQETLRLSAVLEGTDSTEVASSLHSEVTQVLVKEGDYVEKGQLLAVLDETDLAQKVESVNGNVKLIENQQKELLEERQRDYEKAMQDLEKAESDYATAQELFMSQAISRTELEDAERTLSDAKRNLEAIPVENGKAVLQASEKQSLTNAKLDAAMQADQLQDCNIVAPISGTVTRVNAKVGRFADDTEDQAPLFIIENMEKLQMEVSVGEADIGKVEVGQSVEVTADILNGKTVSAVVERISPTGEEKQGGTGGRVIPVLISLNGDKDRLMAGITAKATILLAEEKDVFYVPIEAISENAAGETILYTVDENNAVHILPVTTGMENDFYIAVSAEGLTEGMQVITFPDPSLQEGTIVQVQQ